MELLYALPALILALVGLIGLRKENSNHLYSIRYYKKRNQFIIDWNEVLDKELKEEKRSNASLKGWNTKYVKIIDELKEEWKDLLYRLKRSIKSESITTALLWNKIDESKIVTEKLLTMVKKKDMEEAKAIVKEYYKM